MEEGTDSRTFGWYNYPNDDESDDDDDDEDNYNFETNWRKQVVSNTDTVLLTGVGGWNGVSMKEILIACIINTQCNLISGMVGDEGSMPESGILESPNYPHHYPNDHDSTQTVQVAEGKTIRYVWTNIETEGWSGGPGGPYDYVDIVDEDGTILLSKG